MAHTTLQKIAASTTAATKLSAEFQTGTRRSAKLTDSDFLSPEHANLNSSDAGVIRELLRSERLSQEGMERLGLLFCQAELPGAGSKP